MSGVTIDPSIMSFAQTFGVLALLIFFLIPLMGVSLTVMGRALLKQIAVTSEAIVQTGNAMHALAARVEAVETNHTARLDKLDQNMHDLAVRIDRMPADVRREIDPVFTALNRALERIERRPTPNPFARLFGMERLQ